MTGEHGNQDIKDIVVGSMDIAIVIAGLAKDGIDISDLPALMSHQKVQDAIKNIAEGIENVPAQAKDLDLAEGMDLAMAGILKIPELVEALKKEA